MQSILSPLASPPDTPLGTATPPEGNIIHKLPRTMRFITALLPIFLALVAAFDQDTCACQSHKPGADHDEYDRDLTKWTCLNDYAGKVCLAFFISFLIFSPVGGEAMCVYGLVSKF